MTDMEHVIAVQEAVDVLNDAVAAATRHGLNVEHEIQDYGTMGSEPWPIVETNISRRLERQSN